MLKKNKLNNQELRTQMCPHQITVIIWRQFHVVYIIEDIQLQKQNGKNPQRNERKK